MILHLGIASALLNIQVNDAFWAGKCGTARAPAARAARRVGRPLRPYAAWPMDQHQVWRCPQIGDRRSIRCVRLRVGKLCLSQFIFIRIDSILQFA